MDIFDKYIFDEVVELYAKSNVSEEEYEEIYQRMLSIEYLDEVQPYLYVMRYFGWGTKEEADKVLWELKTLALDENSVMAGVYYDLLLCQDETNAEIKEKLYVQEEMGYTDRFLKGESHVKNSSGKFIKRKRETKQIEKSEKKSNKYDSAVNNGFMYYESGKLEDAERTFRRILMGNIACAEAYLGMLLFLEGKEREEYHAKFIRYVSDDMRELGVVLFDLNIMEKFLDIYSELQDKECFKRIIELNDKEIPFYAMYLAVEKFKDTELLEFLLKNGANPNSFEITKSKYGEGQRCILNVCVRKPEYIEKVQILIKYGANIDYIYKGYNSEGIFFERNVLCSAIRSKQLEIVKLLLEHNANVNSIDISKSKYGKQTYNALSLAIWNTKDVKMVHLLLERGADINYINKGYDASGAYFEKSVLCTAVREKQLEIVKLLLKNNVDINSIDVRRDEAGEQKHNVLALAIWSAKDIEMVRVLLKNGVEVNYINKGYYASGDYFEETALQEAVRFNQLEILKVLLENGANPNDVYIKNKNVYSILGYCIWNNKDFEMIRLLIEYGADVNYVDKWYSKNKYYERNMLCHAIIGRQTDTVNFLLKYGADISQVQTFTSLKKYGEVECKGPALFYAIMGVDLNGTDIEMVEALLQNKSILDKFIIFDGKEYIMKKFPINKFKIHERILGRLQNAGWKGSILGIF